MMLRRRETYMYLGKLHATLIYNEYYELIMSEKTLIYLHIGEFMFYVRNPFIRI